MDLYPALLGGTMREYSSFCLFGTGDMAEKLNFKAKLTEVNDVAD